MGITELSSQTADKGYSLEYRVEAFGSAGTGDYTPFWMVSNRYGIVPLDAGNGYLKPGVFYIQHFGKGFYWNAGIDLVAAAPRYKNVYVQQLYAEIGFQAILLSVGSKEKYTSLWDKNLSSGDMVLSSNARPIPEISISFPEYTTVPLTKGWLHLKAEFAVGRSFDKGYLKHFANEKQVFTNDVLWHRKSGHFRVKDTRGNFPLSIEIGMRHGAQWGGTSTDPKIGIQPHSLKDFIKVMLGKEGGSNASSMDSVNVLGNHYGSYDFRISMELGNMEFQAYHQHFFEDKSGMRFQNKLDGLWGIQIELPKLHWMRKVVLEHLNTRHQSGPFHFIFFDHDKYSGFGGGGDRYYNNEEYTTGLSYFNRSIGTPLLNSPEYNKDGSLGFKNTRTRHFHIGFEGDITERISYRTLFTVMKGWGGVYDPYLDPKGGTSTLVEITYSHPRLEGWLFRGSVGVDTGVYLDKGIGFGFSVSKSGILTAR